MSVQGGKEGLQPVPSAWEQLIKKKMRVPRLFPRTYKQPRAIRNVPCAAVQGG